MRSTVQSALVVLALALLAAAPSRAAAAPVTYSVSLGNNQTSTLTIDGDQLTGLALHAFVATCSNGPSTYSISVGSPATPATIASGAVHVEADGTDDGYGATVHVALDGTLSADRRVLSGTLTFSDLQSTFDSGCPQTVQRFVAIPTPATIPYDPSKSWTLDGRVQLDLGPGRIDRMRASVVPFQCGPAVNEIAFDTQAYALGAIPLAADGSFSLTLDALDEYDVVHVLTISGTAGAAGASVRFHVSDTDVATAFLGTCSGDATLTASPPAATPAAGTPPASATATTPTTPVPPSGGHLTLPRASGPSAVFDWAELRINRGASYSYYFMALRPRCSGGATHVRFSVSGGRAHYVSCHSSLGYASAPVQLAITYSLVAQAVRMRRGRIVSRGPAVATLAQMREPQSGWKPISRLPGPPPTR
ncbi:MAG TPA: hypothetical protein VMT10_00260 [Solirubrobacteraceae bacterium]|nr:hypothetical protein [Solirubrobacteraceae bacterium]